MTKDEILKIKEHNEIHARRELHAIKITEILWRAVDELEHISELEQENAELKAQNEKMKCCENCKYNSYWGNELHCNYGLKEAIKEDKLVECNKMDKWELKEK